MARFAAAIASGPAAPIRAPASPPPPPAPRPDHLGDDAERCARAARRGARSGSAPWRRRRRAMRASRCVPPAPGMMPRRTSVSPSSADSAAMRRSHASASSSPPPNAAPLIAAITGRGSAAIVLAQPVELIEERPRLRQRHRPPFLEVGSGAERPPRAGQHHGADVAVMFHVGGQRLETLGQRRHQRLGQRVRRIRAVDGHERRPLATLDEHQRRRPSTHRAVHGPSTVSHESRTPLPNPLPASRGEGIGSGFYPVALERERAPTAAR